MWSNWAWVREPERARRHCGEQICSLRDELGRIEKICLGIGVPKEHVRLIIPLPKNYEEMERVIKEEIEYRGVSVVVCRRECIQTAKRHLKKQ